jgi:hypothetical protein
MPTPVTESNRQLVFCLLDAVESRDRATLALLYHPQIEFHWPDGLPYGGTHAGAAVQSMTEVFAATWIPLQPTEQERRLDYVLIAESHNEVVVRYFLKGCDRHGRRVAVDTLARYTWQEGKLIRAQMYHFNLVELISFLADR